MRHFCSLFNSAYQYHARLLYESIAATVPGDDFQFYFFCFDEGSEKYFNDLELKNVQIISLQQLESHLPALAEVKASRSLAEYFFTSTPAICKFVFEKYPAVDELVYLDADLFFYQSPELVFEEIGDASVSIIPHRFNLINFFRNIYGYYNVGWITFKRDQDGIACLNKWYENNIEWCFDKLTFSRYADQKYLNRWRRDFNNVHVIRNKGANAAPWNIGNYKVARREGIVYVDKSPLVFYHFASLKFIDGSYYTTISSFFAPVRKEVAELIYRPYIQALYRLGFSPRVSIRLNTNALVSRMRKLIRQIYKDSIIVDR